MTKSLDAPYVLTTPEDFAPSGRTEQFGQGMTSVPDSDGSLAKLLGKSLGTTSKSSASKATCGAWFPARHIGSLYRRRS